MKTRWPKVCRQFGLSRESFYQIQQAFQELGFSSFPSRKRGRKGPGQTERRALRVRPRAEKKNPNDRPGALGCFDPGALWHRDSSDDRAAGSEKLRTRRGKSRRDAFVAGDDPVQGIYENVRCEALEHWRQLPGPWSAFADMEWPACSPAGNRIFPSSFAHRVFLVRPGAGQKTFIARNFVKFMNSSPGR